MKIDLRKKAKVHMIGIKGAGMVGLAEILQSIGMEISGSDTHEKFFTDEVLSALGISWKEGFATENISSQTDWVVYSTAYNEKNNPEMAVVKKRGLPFWSYPEVLAQIFNARYGVAVCGTHGKTTTSALLAEILRKCGKDPSAVVGGRVKAWKKNALSGKGEIFVLEADEFQNKLKLYFPKIAILTSLDWDHPDFFPTFEDYKQVFRDFVAKIPKIGFLAVWGDSANTVAVADFCSGEVIRYGFLQDNDLRIIKLSSENPEKQKFQLFFREKNWGEFETRLVGEHNILNAAATLLVCQKIGVDLHEAGEVLADFSGTTRRFEFIGERNRAVLIDDYAHHPEEIKATLKAARERYGQKKIIVVFHPHSFSRTEFLLGDFAQSFGLADQVLVLDIYGSAREDAGKVSSSDLVKLINRYDVGKAEYVPTIKEVVEFLRDKIGGNDVVLCVGAGNVFEVAEALKEK